MFDPLQFNWTAAMIAAAIGVTSTLVITMAGIRKARSNANGELKLALTPVIAAASVAATILLSVAAGTATGTRTHDLGSRGGQTVYDVVIELRDHPSDEPAQQNA